MPLLRCLALFALVIFPVGLAQSQTYSWNGGDGNWTVSQNWTSGNQTVAWASGSDAIIGNSGSPGTITLSKSASANSVTITSSGYSLTTSGTAARVVTSGTTTIFSNANLTLAPLPGVPINFGSILGNADGTSRLVVGGSTSSASDAIQVNFIAPSSTISNAPITISTSGTQGVAGFVSMTSLTINSAITNNSGVSTMLGATNGNSLTMNASLSGTAGVQFTGGINSSSGTVLLTQASSYLGATTFNGGTTAGIQGVVKLGIANALPTATSLVMGFSSGSGQQFDLNGFSQQVGSLSSNGGVGSITNNGSGTSTLAISGSANTTYSLTIQDGTGKVAVALGSGNTGSLTLTGANSYSGGTTLTGGKMIVTGASATGSGKVTVNSGATLASGSTATISGDITLNAGSSLSPGDAAFGTLSVGKMTVFGTSASQTTFNLDLDLSNSSTLCDKIAASGMLNLSGVSSNGILLVLNSAGSSITSGSKSYQISTGTVSNFNPSQFVVTSSGFAISNFSISNSNGLSISFIASAVAVPEPTSVLAICVMGVVLARSTRRRTMSVS